MKAGVTPEEAVFMSHTAKFWLAWAESRGLKLKVVEAFDVPAEKSFHFAVEFVPN